MGKYGKYGDSALISLIKTIKTKTNTWKLVRCPHISVLIVSFIFSSAASAATVQRDENTCDPVQIILSMKEAYKNVDSYTATMVKGEPALTNQYKPQMLSVKFKRPFKVYMKWTNSVCRGRELIYIAGENDDNFIVKPDGVVGFVLRRLKLPSTYKSDESKYTVRDFGIGNLIDGIIDITLKAQKNNHLDLRCHGVITRGGKEVYKIERFLPKGEGYRNQRLVLYVDAKTNLPCEVFGYGDNGKLAEFCIYRDLVINAPLTDDDFDVDNREYGFNYL